MSIDSSLNGSYYNFYFVFLLDFESEIHCKCCVTGQECYHMVTMIKKLEKLRKIFT